MTKILLVRHGHVEGIEPERFRGRAELVLTDRGRAEAEAIARRIASEWQPSVVYTSPMGRCIDTGAAIARAARLNRVSSSFREKRKSDPELFAAWLATPHLTRFPTGKRSRISSRERLMPCASSWRIIGTTRWSLSVTTA